MQDVEKIVDTIKKQLDIRKNVVYNKNIVFFEKSCY